MPLPQIHGDILSLGYRIGPVAYCPDVSDFPSDTVALISGVGLLVIDALQYKPHPSHFSLSEALEWIEKLKPQRAVLTHMHIPLDYEAARRETPENVEPGYDGMALEFPLIDI
ncbi:MAG TPA: MBL fold metallo-hydrolase, partial [Rhizobiaceae bacterium]|nr:MBL fold metallo-hydrolase [Rhizobiaceae bacterium]